MTTALPTTAGVIAELAKVDPRWQHTAGQLDAYSRVVRMLDGMRIQGAGEDDLRDIALMLAAEAVSQMAYEAVQAVSGQ